MMRVLIVEDDRDTQEGIQYLLDSPVLETVSVHNGLDALEALRCSDFHVDLIVLDLMLPRFSGWELLVELRAHDALAQVPVIILSALAAPPQNLGAQAYIQKPFDPATFIDTVEQVLGIHGAFTQHSQLSPTPSSAPSWKSLGALTTHVLIVDDDAGIRGAVSDLLRDYSFQTSTARDGEEALELILRGTPRIDLIVLDLMMPRSDGWDLLTRLREHPEIRHIPVLVVSALSKAARDLRVEAFLPKPFDGIALIETIERLTNHSISAA